MTSGDDSILRCCLAWTEGISGTETMNILHLNIDMGACGGLQGGGEEAL